MYWKEGVMNKAILKAIEKIVKSSNLQGGTTNYSVTTEEGKSIWGKSTGEEITIINIIIRKEKV